MRSHTERVFRIWNAAALLFLALLAALPHDLLINGPDAPGEYVLSAIGAILLAGFWFCMFVECIRNKALPLRALWMVSFVVVPIFSAFIYFSTTRSWRSDDTLPRTTDGL